MNATEFKAIEEKVEKLKAQEIRYNSQLEAVLEFFKEAGVITIEEAKKLLATKEQEIADAEEFVEAEFAKLKGLTAWQFV